MKLHFEARSIHHTARKSQCAPRRLASRNRPAPRRHAVEAPGTAATEAPEAHEDVWRQFAANVSGEWEGVTATFSPTGPPQPLPQHYVPEAFREWGVELWDWQSQCSAVADAEQKPGTAARNLKSTVRRLMPTVGCEADAIAFTEEDASSSSSIGSSSNNEIDQVLLVSADGSYSAGPGLLSPVSTEDGPSKFQIEHCFALPQPGSAGEPPQQQQQQGCSNRSRIKVVQQFRRDWSKGTWVLAAVDLHRERYDGPYTGKRELAGCGGGQPGIAQLAALQQAQLSGDWAAQEGAATCCGQGIDAQQQSSRLSCLDSSGATPEGVQLTLLPLGAWSAVSLTAEGQLQRAEAGVLVGQEHQQLPSNAGSSNEAAGTLKLRRVSCRSFESGSGQLAFAVLGSEERL